MNGRDRRFEALTGGHLTPARYGGPPLFVPSMVAPALRRARGAGGEPMVDNTARRRLITDSDQTMTVAVARAMSKSAELLDIAAEAGDTEARFALGLLYMLGRGVEENLGEAFRLFGLAAAAGDEQAEVFRGMTAEKLAREEVSKHLMEEASVAIIKEAKRKKRFPKPRIVKPD